MMLTFTFIFNPQNVSDNPFERVQDVTTSLHFKDFAEKFNTRLEDLNNSLQVADLKKHLSADNVSSKGPSSTLDSVKNGAQFAEL